MAFPGVRMHLSNNGHATVFFLPRSCTFTSVTSVSCCDPAIPFSLWLSLREGGSCWWQNLQQSLAREPARNRWKSSHNRSKAVLVLSFLKTYNIFWGCFGVFRTISDIVFKADILPTDDFFEWQVSCASPTHPFPRQLQRRSDIGYECSDQRCST